MNGLYQVGQIGVSLVCRIQCFLECIPVILYCETGFAFENDGLWGVWFLSVSPRHKVPWPFVMVCNTVNFIVKVFAFSHFHCVLYIAPLIWWAIWFSISRPSFCAGFIPPPLQMNWSPWWGSMSLLCFNEALANEYCDVCNVITWLTCWRVLHVICNVIESIYNIWGEFSISFWPCLDARRFVLYQDRKPEFNKERAVVWFTVLFYWDDGFLIIFRKEDKVNDGWDTSIRNGFNQLKLVKNG